MAVEHTPEDRETEFYLEDCENCGYLEVKGVRSKEAVSRVTVNWQDSGLYLLEFPTMEQPLFADSTDGVLKLASAVYTSEVLWIGKALKTVIDNSEEDLRDSIIEYVFKDGTEIDGRLN